MKLKLSAPAKINWFLAILGQRSDGYHDIMSPTQCISLFDDLSFEDAENIELISGMETPAEENLVYRAARMLKEISGFRKGAKITLRKSIPLAAGLGGGSSDAASTLIGLNRLWALGYNNDRLMEVAALIGSDVPFFIGGRFSLIEGRGERVRPLKAESAVPMLLVKPDIEISSEWAYRNCGVELTKRSIDIKLFCQALDRMDFARLREMVFNDLEKAVVEVYPVVEEIKKKLVENGAVLSCMSGSGPTVFGVFGSVDEAGRASLNMGEKMCRVVRTLV
ncbi:MAG: 4-(cytidine 5'-diphospho)-2-C-methyl-D-erythritol kinase [Candidatus Sulfobium sp.]|jgi:4-diphosphocytidyl-2-C-methyl-D-erythritol kinase